MVNLKRFLAFLFITHLVVMVTLCWAESNTPEKRVLFLGGVFGIRGDVLRFVRKRLCLLRADGA